MNPFYIAVPILIKRSFQNMLRQPLFMVSRVLQVFEYYNSKSTKKSDIIILGRGVCVDFGHFLHPHRIRPA